MAKKKPVRKFFSLSIAMDAVAKVLFDETGESKRELKIQDYLPKNQTHEKKAISCGK